MESCAGYGNQVPVPIFPESRGSRAAPGPPQIPRAWMGRGASWLTRVGSFGYITTVIIPNAARAVVDIRKLRDYSLNPMHRADRHKARLFAALLGMTMENAEALRDILLQVVCTHEVTLGERDQYGQRYRLDFLLNWRDRQAPLRSIWNVRPAEDFPRLVTCYPVREVSV